MANYLYEEYFNFRFSGIFPSIQGAIKKREQSLQEYNKCQSRVDKYQDRDRTGQNVVKLDSVRTLNPSYTCDTVKPVLRSHSKR